MKQNNWRFAAAAIAVTALLFSACPTGNEKNEGEAGGTVAITGNPWVGATLTADISGLGGTGNAEFQWVIGDVEIPSEVNQTYTIRKSEHGLVIKVKARRAGETDWVESAPTNPVINGYVVKTISRFLLSPDGESDTGRRYNDAKNIVIKDGKLYIASNASYVGAGIIEIDPAQDPGENGLLEGTSWAVNTDNSLNEGAKYIAANNNSLFVGIEWGRSRSDESYILRFDSKKNVSDWQSGDIYIEAKKEHSYYKNNWLQVGFDVDAAGNMYVATTMDHGANGVLKVTPDKTVSVLAGTSENAYAEGTGTAAKFGGLSGIAVDASNNVYVADGYSDGRIRKITPDGVTSTFAGGVWGVPFITMGQITFDKDGYLYVINNVGKDDDAGGKTRSPQIVKVSPDGKTTNTIAGKGGYQAETMPVDDGWSALDGIALTEASFYNLLDIAVADDGTIYALDSSKFDDPTEDGDNIKDFVVVRKIYLDNN